MAVLVTGGLGYIGSHTVVELLENNEEVVIVDNLLNSKLSLKDRIEEITNNGVKYYNIDLVNEEDVRKVFNENRIESVIHFAALKAVGESVEKPIEYFHNNLVNTLVVLKIMKEFSVKNFVFSSSATVYGNAKEMPIKENFSLSVTNPYGRTKLMIEDILRDVYFSDNSWNIAILRYFNPVGANKSGRIGEDPNGIPNNIMPYITKVAIGELKQVNVFGNDYPTIDGTGVRDYIHVVDLAKGHIKALDKLKSNCGLVTYNLGTGKGYSVLELIKAFSEASGKEIPFEITERRAGDVAICYADPSKANSELGWKAERDINDMCKDSWKWQTMNPMGYQ